MILSIDSDHCQVLCGNGNFFGEKFVISDGNYILMDEEGTVIYEQIGSGGMELRNETAVRSFEYHDDGYITLSPFGELYQDIDVTWSAGSNVVYLKTNEPLPTGGVVGQFIRINGEWHKIVSQLNDGGYVLSTRFDNAGRQLTMITTMNELIIEGEGLNLEDISIAYTPKV